MHDELLRKRTLEHAEAAEAALVCALSVLRHAPDAHALGIARQMLVAVEIYAHRAVNATDGLPW
jgi:hypothetical protein